MNRKSCMTLAVRAGKAVGYRLAKPAVEHRDMSGFGGGVNKIFALLGCYIA